MTEPAPDLPPLGRLLEGARVHLKLSKREAARRAGISEARWRQIVTGLQNPSDPSSNVARPRSNTVAAAARAVEVDPDEALRLAGLDPLPASSAPAENRDDALRRILLADIDVDRKEQLIKFLIEEHRKTNKLIGELVDKAVRESLGEG